MTDVVAAKQILVPQGLPQEVAAVWTLLSEVHRRREARVAGAWARGSRATTGRRQRPDRHLDAAVYSSHSSNVRVSCLLCSSTSVLRNDSLQH